VDCTVGQAVSAVWQGNGQAYPAVIASINGGMVTVNWSDGDARFRETQISNVRDSASGDQCRTPADAGAGDTCPYKNDNECDVPVRPPTPYI
jgi:hypothetical protein